MPVEREDVARNKIPEPELWKSYDAAVRGSSARPFTAPQSNSSPGWPQPSASATPRRASQASQSQGASFQPVEASANDPMQSLWSAIAPPKQTPATPQNPAQPRPAAAPPAGRPPAVDRAQLYTAIRTTAGASSPAQSWPAGAGARAPGAAYPAYPQVNPPESAFPPAGAGARAPGSAAYPPATPSALAAPSPAPDRRSLYESIRQLYWWTTVGLMGQNTSSVSWN